MWEPESTYRPQPLLFSVFVVGIRSITPAIVRSHVHSKARFLADSLLEG
jgi:hypothetical protein